jgi:hypothetical protein
MKIFRTDKITLFGPFSLSLYGLKIGMKLFRTDKLTLFTPFDLPAVMRFPKEGMKIFDSERLSLFLPFDLELGPPPPLMTPEIISFYRKYYQWDLAKRPMIARLIRQDCVYLLESFGNNWDFVPSKDGWTLKAKINSLAPLKPVDSSFKIKYH